MCVLKTIKSYHILNIRCSIDVVILFTLINMKLSGCARTHGHRLICSIHVQSPSSNSMKQTGWIKVVVLLLCCRTKINLFCFGDARCLLHVVFSDPAKIVEKAKGMSRENPSVEEKSMFLNHFNFSFYKLHYIKFYYKNPLSQYRKSLKEESSTGLDN